MKRLFILFLLGVFTLMPILPSVSAQTIQAGSKLDWVTAQQQRIEQQTVYNTARINYGASKTPENEQKMIDEGKKLLDDWLAEAEEWLYWKNTEAEADPRVPDDIRTNIQNDVNKNLTQIANLKQEVDAIQNQAQLGITFIKMVVAYSQLLVDVARNVGAMWVAIGNNLLATTSQYEKQLRTAAQGMSDNAEIMQKLDSAKSELDAAQKNVDSASAAYKQVVFPGTPFIKFAEGNNNLQLAKLNLITAQNNLSNVFLLITTNNQ